MKIQTNRKSWKHFECFHQISSNKKWKHVHDNRYEMRLNRIINKTKSNISPPRRPQNIQFDLRFNVNIDICRLYVGAWFSINLLCNTKLNDMLWQKWIVNNILQELSEHDRRLIGESWLRLEKKRQNKFSSWQFFLRFRFSFNLLYYLSCDMQVWRSL